MFKNFLYSIFVFALISLNLVAEPSNQHLKTTYNNDYYSNDLNCHNAFYVRKLNNKSGKKDDFIVRNKTEISMTLQNSQCNLFITDLDSCCFRNKMKFHIPNLSDVTPFNSFVIEQAFDTGSNLPIKSQPGIYLESKYESGTFAMRGGFKILELLLDIKNNEVLSLAIDFAFQDDKANTYDGVIRYNSSIKAE